MYKLLDVKVTLEQLLKLGSGPVPGGSGVLLRDANGLYLKTADGLYLAATKDGGATWQKNMSYRRLPAK